MQATVERTHAGNAHMHARTHARKHVCTHIRTHARRTHGRRIGLRDCTTLALRHLGLGNLMQCNLIAGKEMGKARLEP